MAASARQGERASSFAMACSLLSRYVRQNGAAPAELDLGINNAEAEAKITLPGADGGEAGRRETMELFPQSAGLGAVQDAAASDAASENIGMGRQGAAGAMTPTRRCGGDDDIDTETELWQRRWHRHKAVAVTTSSLGRSFVPSDRLI